MEGFEPPTRLRILITNQAESTAIRHWPYSLNSFPNRDAKVVILDFRRKVAYKKSEKVKPEFISRFTFSPFKVSYACATRSWCRRSASCFSASEIFLSMSARSCATERGCSATNVHCLRDEIVARRINLRRAKPVFFIYLFLPLQRQTSKKKKKKNSALSGSAAASAYAGSYYGD